MPQQPAHWADKDLDLARRRGLLRGDPDGGMRPDANASRAEIAVIANRLYDMTRESFVDLIAKVEPCVVTVINEKDGRPQSQGSGTSIGGGLVLTNAHVVRNDDGTTDALYGISWTAWSFGEAQTRYAMAELVHVADIYDLAVLRVGITERGDMPVLPLGEGAMKAEPCAVVGTPVGLAGSVSVGIVSAIARQMNYEIYEGQTARIPEMVQTDAPINPGNSGGALVNLRGELIGVPSVKLAHLAYEGLGFAIGVQTVRQVLDEAGIKLAPKPAMYRPAYDPWYITAATHTRTNDVLGLVVHHEGAEGGTPESIHRYHVQHNEWAAVGYHALIAADGTIYEGRPDWAIGAHAKGHNDCTLGICLLGNLDLHPPTDAQFASLLVWLRWQKLMHPKAVIVGHGELMATDCPGKHIDMDATRQAI